jgi:hypothetical protein
MQTDTSREVITSVNMTSSSCEVSLHFRQCFFMAAHFFSSFSFTVLDGLAFFVAAIISYVLFSVVSVAVAVDIDVMAD